MKKEKNVPVLAWISKIASSFPVEPGTTGRELIGRRMMSTQEAKTGDDILVDGTRETLEEEVLYVSVLRARLVTTLRSSLG